MMYHRRLAALLLLSLVAVVPPCARAQDPELRQKYDELRQKYDELKLQKQLLELQEMRSRLATLEQRVAELEAKTSQPRVSRYLGPNTGTIRLLNQLSVPATFIVGGKPYRVQAGQTQDIAEPAGPFFYEVLVDGFGEVQPRVTRTLRPGQLFTIYTYLP